MANEGKRFERKFKESAIQQGLLCVRFNDSDLSYNISKELRSSFTPTNPADFLIYKTPNVFFIENKSTKYKTISFERTVEDIEAKNGMIHAHQIRDMSNLVLHDGVYAGFVFNFRVEDEWLPYSERTYYMSIQNFNDFFCAEDRKSINQELILRYGGFEINATQKRKLYTYDIEDMLKKAVSF